MKQLISHWLFFVACTVLCWGAYVPTIHQGQQSLGGKNPALRAFLFVGLAYFLVASGVLAYMWYSKTEPFNFPNNGMAFSTLAGVLGALGALGVAFALKSGGRPYYVAPLVFAGAPIVNTIVSMIWHPPEKSPSAWFYLGLLLAASGAGLVLRFKPA